MADQQVKFSNFYESTISTGGLPQSVTSCTLTAAPTTEGTTAIGANYYLVVDPDSASSREIIEVTAATGTSLTAITRDVEGRYGTAGDASTAPNHSEGAVVRMAVVRQMFEDLHDRVDADEVTNAAHRASTSNPHTVTFAQLGLLDEDDMTSNSATAAPSQQSVKAYVDAQNAAQSLGASIGIVIALS